MKPHKAPLNSVSRLSAKIGERFPVNPCKHKINCVNLFSTFLPETVLSEQKEERAFFVFGLNFPNPPKEGLPMKKVLTVTFDSCKPLHTAPSSAPFCGEIVCADIGIRDEWHPAGLAQL